MTRLLEVQGLSVRYVRPRRHLLDRPGQIEAVRGVDLHVSAGESLGLVGESGSGKSTLARAILGLQRPSTGRILLDGRDVYADPAAVRPLMQMVFQDPYGSLDPRWTVGRTIAEPLGLLSPVPDRTQRAGMLDRALSDVGLDPAMATRYPHEFSGGQRQRIAIARALITRPRLIVADEPVSALDVSVQAQILNLMSDLQASHDLAYLFISHDLGVMRTVTDRVAVMQSGEIVETGPTASVLSAPKAGYTQTLLAAEPRLDPARRRRRSGRRGTPAPAQEPGEPERGEEQR